jgi:hypothetical protein
LVASPSLTPGSIFSSEAVALLMSTTSALGAAAVLRTSEVEAFGIDGTAGAIVAEGEVVLGAVVVAG